MPSPATPYEIPKIYSSDNPYPPHTTTFLSETELLTVLDICSCFCNHRCQGGCPYISTISGRRARLILLLNCAVVITFVIGIVTSASANDGWGVLSEGTTAKQTKTTLEPQAYPVPSIDPSVRRPTWNRHSNDTSTITEKRLYRPASFQNLTQTRPKLLNPWETAIYPPSNPPKSRPTSLAEYTLQYQLFRNTSPLLYIGLFFKCSNSDALEEWRVLDGLFGHICSAYYPC